MQYFPRVIAAVALAYSLNLLLDLIVVHFGLTIGTDANPRIAASAWLFGARLIVAIIAGTACAIMAGQGRIMVATLLLMAVYALDGIRVGRAIVAAGHLPFSSAILSLLCVSFCPIGAIVYANRKATSHARIQS